MQQTSWGKRWAGGGGRNTTLSREAQVESWDPTGAS